MDAACGITVVFYASFVCDVKNSVMCVFLFLEFRDICNDSICTTEAYWRGILLREFCFSVTLSYCSEPGFATSIKLFLWAKSALQNSDRNTSNGSVK